MYKYGDALHVALLCAWAASVVCAKSLLKILRSQKRLYTYQADGRQTAQVCSFITRGEGHIMQSHTDYTRAACSMLAQVITVKQLGACDVHPVH